MRFIKPNFKNSILNVSASFANFLNAENSNATNKILDKYLKNTYKNVVFIIMDGMGIHPLKVNLNKKSFLRKNIKSKITSTFPSTTTNATTTFITNKMPLEHGYLGWCVYFEEIDKIVDLYLSKDSYTKEEIDSSFLKNRFKHEPYYKTAKTDFTINTVVPPYWHDGIDANRYVFEEDSQIFDVIKAVCKKDGKQFIYSYLPDPDHTMHDFGVTSPKAKEVIESINENVEKLANELEDTLIVISADHGQTDVVDYVELYKDEKLFSMLETMPYLEPRATAFRVKEEFKKEFEKHFNKTYKKDFKLYKTSKLLQKNYFGVLTENKCLLGDFIAVAKTDKVFLFAEDSHKFKGHHTSLGKEMLVPLIIIDNKNRQIT